MDKLKTKILAKHQLALYRELKANGMELDVRFVLKEFERAKKEYHQYHSQSS